jgi:hypothetical protein
LTILEICPKFKRTVSDYAREIEIVASQGLRDRFTHQIYFREPNEEEAFEYVRELPEYYRTEQPELRGLSNVYPFDEEALRVLIDDLGSRTPRVINQRCVDVITEAFQKGLITAPGQGIISKEFVRSVEDRYIGAELV